MHVELNNKYLLTLSPLITRILVIELRTIDFNIWCQYMVIFIDVTITGRRIKQ